MRLTFDGWIAGVGTTSGARVVVGHWPRSPFGPISDVMICDRAGFRRLLAPSSVVGEFIASTYTFDAVEILDVLVRPGPSAWAVRAGGLELEFGLGRRPPLGVMLRAVPASLARRPGWVGLLDRPARVLLPGVRTTGSAGNGRREWYGAHDLRAITAVAGRCDGDDLGSLADVHPPPRFGFGSVPRRPALVRVTTTVEVPEPDAPRPA